MYSISRPSMVFFHRSQLRMYLVLQEACVFAPGRAVASLTVPGGQEFHFPHFFPNFDNYFLFFLKLFSFSSSFWLSGWATRQPGKALATPLAPGLCTHLISNTKKKKKKNPHTHTHTQNNNNNNVTRNTYFLETPNFGPYKSYCS